MCYYPTQAQRTWTDAAKAAWLPGTCARFNRANTPLGLIGRYTRHRRGGGREGRRGPAEAARPVLDLVPSPTPPAALTPPLVPLRMSPLTPPPPTAPAATSHARPTRLERRVRVRANMRPHPRRATTTEMAISPISPISRANLSTN